VSITGVPITWSEMSEPFNNGSHSGFWLPVLMISVIVRIIITGFEDFGSGYGFWFLFRFTVLKNWIKGIAG